MIVPPTTVKVIDPPPREPWEQPRAEGWGSAVRDLGTYVLRLALVALVGLGLVRVVQLALHLGHRRTHGLKTAIHIGAWVVAIAVAVALLIWLAKRLGDFALMLAMLTDHGRTARMRGRPPVWLDEPPADAENPLRLAHLSDLHLAEGETVRLVERAAPAGNPALPALLDCPAVRESDFLVFTGDITDRGTAAAWRAFFAEVDARGLAQKILLVPGNHDLCLVEHVDTAKLRGGGAKGALKSDMFGIVHLANLLKFGEAFARTGGGERGWVLWSSDWGPQPEQPALPSGGRPLAPEVMPFRAAFSVVEKLVRPVIESLADTPIPPIRLGATLIGDVRARAAYVGRIERARNLLLDLFPVAVPMPERDAVFYVLNSSVRVSRHLATNALGYLGYAQTRRLDRISLSFPEKLRLLGLHHHLVRRGEELAENFVARVFAKFAVLADAWRVARFCRQRGVRAVLNGHRHLSYQLRTPEGCVYLAAPSSTLGDELTGDPRPRMERYDFLRSTPGPTVGIYRREVRADAAAQQSAERTAAG